MPGSDHKSGGGPSINGRSSPNVLSRCSSVLGCTSPRAHDFVSLNDIQHPGTVNNGGAFHVNLAWYLSRSSNKVMTSVEYIGGLWETMDGRKGIADRVQFGPEPAAANKEEETE